MVRDNVMQFPGEFQALAAPGGIDRPANGEPTERTVTVKARTVLSADASEAGRTRSLPYDNRTAHHRDPRAY